MKKLFLLALILIAIIVTAAFLIPPIINTNTKTHTFYVGISFCGETVQQAKQLIDKTRNYTNLFVLQSFTINRNETATKEVCDYAVAQGLNIILNLGTHNDTTFPWQLPLLENATNRWGSKFLGVYYDDEPGGVQLDYDWASYFASLDFANFSRFPNPLYKIYQDTQNPNASTSRNYTRAANWFTNVIRWTLIPDRWQKAGITSFTSDYALYWWDYLGGYNVLLAQLGWNHTLTQDIALVRGAARMQNKTWGTIITWKYNQTPYIDSAENIYQQLLMSYQTGAKYSVIFNYPHPENSTYGVLTDEHFTWLEKFWNDTMAKPNKQDIPDYSQAEAALVLPQSYGWGMRSPGDRIWGMWEPDAKSPQIWNISRTLLSKYGLSLDIVYEEQAFPVAGKYPKIYYWNQTVQP